MTTVLCQLNTPRQLPRSGITVLRLLTTDQECIGVTNSEKNLAYFKRNPKEFLRRFVTMDVTWIHHYAPESREG